MLTGLTYKEIGAQLFISAKTVEHHMARIRRRLGAPAAASCSASSRPCSTRNTPATDLVRESRPGPGERAPARIETLLAQAAHAGELAGGLVEAAFQPSI